MKFKKMKWVAIISAVALAVAIMTVSVMAYFSTIVYVYTNDGNKEKFHAGMNLTLLFDKLVPDASLVDDTTKLPFIDYANTTDPENPVYYTYDKDATWGTEKNPYIISDIRHLQNLSALQDIGYFYKLNIINNFNKDTNGNPTTYIAGSNNKPYFLICKNDGTPVTINGEGISIKPIGTDEYPFIGEIGGAILDGTTTVPTTNKGDLQSDTSAIFNIKVMSKRKMPDHGLFGYVSYLGAAPGTTGYDTAAGTIAGYVSKISDLLMADVTLEVKDTNFVDTVADWMSTHIFSYKEFDESAQSSVPHETHHIGILAGHVNYVDVENISIYYSSDDIICIDLNDKQSVVGTADDPDGDPDDDKDTKDFDNNYFSSTGIIGYIYSMNPQYSGNVIDMGSGSSSASIGDLGGGGENSGTNPGYVLAYDMYNKYMQFSKTPVLTDDKLPTYSFGLNDDGSKLTGIMVYAILGNDNKPIFMDEIGRQLFPVNADANGYYVDGGWQYKQQTTGENWKYVKLQDTPFFYCQNEINAFDSDGNYKSAPVYYTAINDWEEYDLTNESNGKTYKLTRLKGTGKLDSPSMELVGYDNRMYLYSANKDANGTDLCIQWYRDRLFNQWIGFTKEATGRYYFKDGVFTFALSNTSDTIREIWPKAGSVELIPSILLAENWTTGKREDYTFITTLKKVTGTPTATGNYILVYPSTDTNGNTTYYFVQLMGGGVENQGGLGMTPFPAFTGGDTVEIDVGKNDPTGTTFSNYVFNYNATANNNLGKIVSASSSGMVLGVYALSQRIGDNYTFYPFSGSTEDHFLMGTIPYINYDVVIERYDYTYNASLTTSGNKWGVYFQNIEHYRTSGLFGYTLKTVNRYLTVSNNVLDVPEDSSTAEYPFLLYEVLETKYQEITPENAPNSMVPDGDYQEYLANQFVLYPQSTTSGTTTRWDTKYSLIDVANLGFDGEKGTWRFEDGTFLYEQPQYMKYMFDLVEGTKYGTIQANMDTIGGDWDENSAFVQAELGTDDSKTYIPMGCISFKVKKKPAEGDPIKIRVIVAVPTGAKANDLTYDEDYFFGLWKSSLYAGSTAEFDFQKNATLEKFELPRSQPLYNGETLADQNGYDNPIQVQYDTNGNGKADDGDVYYNTYFQGETVLVAYEFTVDDVGVYTLGAIGGPMQIVYFSADGVASMGRDGTGGAYLKGIDFVYDTVEYYDYLAEAGNNVNNITIASSNKIVTVKNAPDGPFKNPTTNEEYEDYNYYYESNCLLHFDNTVEFENDFIKIYCEMIKIRRYYDGDSEERYQKTAMNFTVVGEEITTERRYVILESVDSKCDVIKPSYSWTPPSQTS